VHRAARFSARAVAFTVVEGEAQEGESLPRFFYFYILKK